MPLSPANAALVSATRRLCVLLPVPLGETFDYRPLPGPALEPGQLVRVPFRRREVVGVVWDGPVDSCDSTPPPPDKLKPVIASMGGVAASGGYYVVAGAHHVTIIESDHGATDQVVSVHPRPVAA